ncbi:MAG: DNA polymerase III subunit gamma/tau [Actinomycetota bacterium]|nr:DNA polymerase III subunit gamma/tau [Actinomycetota bacterium]
MSSGSTYSSLYRRFRPQRFSEVLGQEHVTRALRNAVANSKVGHAYLFSGPRGTGKTSTARILAKALNCANAVDGEPCGECDSCLAIADGRSMDVIELDAASNSGVDAVRSLIAQAPVGTTGEWKVYILDEVHMLSTAASNALLKTLEEPPPHVVFVLATTDPQKVLPTILSRTQSFEFRLLDEAVLDSLVEKVAASAELGLGDEALTWAVKRGRGSARDTLSFLDQVAALGGIDDTPRGIEEIFAAVAKGDPAAVLLGVDQAVRKGLEPARINAELVGMARDRFLASFDPATAAPGMSTARLVKMVESLGSMAGQMRDSLDPRATLEAALIRLARDAMGAPAELEELVQRTVAGYLKRMGSQPQPVQPASRPPREPEPDDEPVARSHAPRVAPAPHVAELKKSLGDAEATPPAPTQGLSRVMAARDRSQSQPRPQAPAPQSRSPQAPRPLDRDHLVSAWPEILTSLSSLLPLERSALNQGRFVSADSNSATFLVSNPILRDRCVASSRKIEAAICKRFGVESFSFRVDVDDEPTAKPVEEAPAEEMLDEFANGVAADRRAIGNLVRQVFPGAIELGDAK